MPVRRVVGPRRCVTSDRRDTRHRAGSPPGAVTFHTRTTPAPSVLATTRIAVCFLPTPRETYYMNTDGYGTN